MFTFESFIHSIPNRSTVFPFYSVGSFCLHCQQIHNISTFFDLHIVLLGLHCELRRQVAIFLLLTTVILDSSSFLRNQEFMTYRRRLSITHEYYFFLRFLSCPLFFDVGGIPFIFFALYSGELNTQESVILWYNYLETPQPCYG